MKVVNIVTINSNREYGHSIELLYNMLRIGLFTATEPFTITFLLGLWKFNLITELIKG